MKVNYENFGCLSLEVEDGRDSAWLCEMAQHLSEHAEAPILDNFFQFEDADSKDDTLTIKDAAEACALSKVDINIFGHLASPYEFEKLHEVYWKSKESIRTWIKERKKKNQREDAVAIWNKLFPDEKI